jgi:multiple sugar transport system ATP-binding protein
MNTMAASLHIAGIRKTFGKGDKTVEVLKRIDIDVAPGEFLILVGPSGCGKSTLLNIIAGLDEPTEGEIRISGRNVVGVAPAQRDIAMVFQSYALYPSMSVAENIGFALEMRKVPKAERLARVQQVAATLQISHLLDRRPSQLSRGHGPGAGPSAAALLV